MFPISIRRLTANLAATAAVCALFSTNACAEETAAATAAARKLPAVVSFNAHIRPLMSNTCFVCHGPDEEENPSGFRIDTFEHAIRPLPSDESLVGIKPNDPQASEVIRRIMGEGDGDVMPPPEFRHQLSDYDKALFRKWIEQGAKYEQHWSYAPIQRPAVPELTKHQDKVFNAIDAFVLHRLEEEGLDPSDVADRATLLRRLSLDLIGLPPTTEELTAFLNDRDANAYEKQVERLLASKHFGERMASSWLDIVRFADTVGFHGDQNQRVFPYRDYVIQSFNDNKPFDEFTREQIAGDLLPNPTADQLVATGALRMNMVTREGGAQPGEYLAKSKADRVRALGTAWLGVTLACCECHNHKYDPFSIKDFYSLGAFFDDLRQWGVYADYGYTPNKDLAGFNNDYPFPPETRVKSAAAVAEIEHLQRERDARLLKELRRETLNSEAYQQWQKNLIATLKAHRDGWQPLAIHKATASGKTTAQVEPDQSVLLQGPAEGKSKVDLFAQVEQPTWIQALRLEVLPDDRNGGFVGRGADGRFTVSLSAAVREAHEVDAQPIPLQSRYVRIELPGKSKILSLAEVQVFAEAEAGGLENVALKGKASQPSTHRDGQAEHAIDGNTDGDYYRSKSVTHNVEGDDPWWEVDLGTASRIRKIVLWNRTDGNYASRLTDYRVKLLDADRRVLHEARPGTPAPSLELQVPTEVTPDNRRTLEFAWIEADLQNTAQYQQGREPRMLKQPWRSGPIAWQFPADETRRTHTAVFHLATPLQLTPGQRFEVTLDSNDVGRVRLSTTALGHAIAGWPAAAETLVHGVAAPADSLSTDEAAALVSAYHRSVLPVAKQSEISHAYRDRILDLRSGYAMSLIAQAIPESAIPASKVRPRGNWQDESGEAAPPAFPEFLPHPSNESNRRLTRLDLANWLTAADNPLTSRHFVNRTWKHFFGAGLSAKLDDLGNQGEWPSHPLLLDWLAAEFIENGWNVKQIIRLMVTSRTYQQAAAVRSDLGEVDPYNRLLAQQSARRLEAEAVRDNALAIAGLLHTAYVGGPSVFPYQPDGHYANLQFPDRNYVANQDYRQYRRGVYMHWQRTFLHPMLVNFDAPSRDECAADRPLSNSPQQALTLLNDPTFVEASRVMAKGLLQSLPEASFEDRLHQAFLKAVSRRAEAREVSSLKELYDRQWEYFTKHPEDAKSFQKVGYFSQDEVTDVAELAAWSQVCRVILNLHETITRY